MFINFYLSFFMCSRLWHTRHAIARTCLCAHLKHSRRGKKSMLCLIRKIQCVRQIARLKQQLSLSFTFYKTQRSYEKIICICYFIGSVVKIVLSEAATRGARYKKVFLKFAKVTGKYKCHSLFFNKFAGAATSLLIALTWKSLNIVYRKLMKFFKVLPKENLKSACKRYVLHQKQPPEVFYEKVVLKRHTTLFKKRLSGTDVFLWILQNF